MILWYILEVTALTEKYVAKFEDCKKDRTILNTNSFFVLFINYYVLYCFLYVNKDTGNAIFLPNWMTVYKLKQLSLFDTQRNKQGKENAIAQLRYVR